MKKLNGRVLALLGVMLMLWGVVCSCTGCDLLQNPFAETGSDTAAPVTDEAPTEAETPAETQPEIVGTLGLQYGKTFEGDYHVSVYTGSNPRVVIPPYHEGKPVVRIERGAFSRDALSSHTRVNDKIVSVEIPDTVKSIAEDAFLRCYKLESIHIPASVEYIEPDAFRECTGLKSITVDPANTHYRAENNCLIEIATGTLVAGCADSVIPDDGSIKAIGRWAFYKCTGLTRIRIPASVEELPEEAFFGCTSLARVEGCEGLVTIGEGAFSGCVLLMDFPFPETLVTIDQKAFYGCDTLSLVTFPGGLKKIGWYAFSGCNRLYQIELPPALEFIGGEAFGFTGIKTVTVPEGYTTVNNMLQDMRLLETVYLPSTLEKLMDSEFSYCYELRDIYYNGTLEQWLTIVEKDQVWMGFVKEWTLHCTDGDTQWVYAYGSGMKQVK